MAEPKKKKIKKSKKRLVKKITRVKKTIRRGVLREARKKEPIEIKLERARHNPIIEPRSHAWESKATFNPSAIEAKGKVHLIYRAIGDDDSSALGYATSHDGYNISDRPSSPAYMRQGHFSRPDISLSPIDYISGGGWNGGCEDPRLTLLGGTVYMLYTAFDGWGSLRLALTSIKLKELEDKNWNWKKAVMISPPNEIHKNWVLFPEKIKGKYAILHSFYPKIKIDYFASLNEFDGKKFIKSDNARPADPSRTWDSWFRGVGPSPIKTDIGWLVLYHAMNHRNPDRYRLGAIVLDSEDPTKILYRSQNPILEPEEDYENSGHKWGVVYSCGALVKNGTLFVYYGGADKVIGVATIKLVELLEDLKKHKVIKLKKRATKSTHAKVI